MIDDFFGDGEAETVTAGSGLSTSRVGPIKTVEDMGEIFGVDANAGVGDFNFDVTVDFFGKQGNGGVGGAVLDGVVQKNY